MGKEGVRGGKGRKGKRGRWTGEGMGLRV